jgi:DNA topoisomerase-2
MRGVYEVLNTTTVNITELPPSMTFQKYEVHLNTLQDRGIIVSYDDNSSNGINYTLKFARATLADLIGKGRLDQTLKMIETETENLTCLNEKGKLAIFEDITQVVDYFVNFRLSFYDKRKAFLIKKYGEELIYLSNRAKFIKLIIDGKLKVNNVPRKEIILYLQTADFDEVNGSYNYLLNMPIHSLTKETYEQLLKEVADIKSLLVDIKKKDPTEMYREDLFELKKNLKYSSK